MATKRRKVWVVLNDDGELCMATLHASEARAAAADARADGHSQRAICTVERLPGDVVLSREDAALLKTTIKQLEKIAQEHLGQRAPVSVLALLRGRR